VVNYLSGAAGLKPPISLLTQTKRAQSVDLA
jgi:hypothetical protein